jgi:glycosyltransferase involved in cell wall biosynthesis
VANAIRIRLFSPKSPDIFTFMAARELLPPELANSIVKESLLAQIPGIRQRGHDPGHWRYLLPYMPHYFRSLDLREYDVVISSSHACAAHVRPPKGALHVVYCYTPMRYAWMPETDQRHLGGLADFVFRNFRSWLQRLDYEAAQRPDLYLAISTAVQERIHRFYGRSSIVVGAPVEAEDIRLTEEKDDGLFLWVHRLVPYKRPEVVIEAFREEPYRLTMVGVGPLEQMLRKRLPPNVELLSWISRAQLIDLYQRSSGFIHVGEEDFGITMVEALAAGTPVIALDAGGARDIIRRGVDGVLIERPTITDLRAAVRSVAQRQWNRELLAVRAAEFGIDAFTGRMLSAIRELMCK